MAKVSLPTIPFEKLAALTLVQRIIIFAGTLLLLGGGFFYFFYLPKAGRISELNKSHDELMAKVQTAKRVAATFDKVSKQHQQAQTDLRLVLRLLPDKREIPGLLENISKSGRYSGLEFLLFQPSKEVLKDFYAEIPVKIEVTGGYHNLAMFFDKVAKLSRIVNLTNLSVKQSSAKKGQGTLRASCVATTYRFVGSTESTGKKKKKKKKRG